MFPRTCPSCGQLGLSCIIGNPCSNCGVSEVKPSLRRPEPRPEEEARVKLVKARPLPPDTPAPEVAWDAFADLDELEDD